MGNYKTTHRAAPVLYLLGVVMALFILPSGGNGRSSIRIYSRYLMEVKEEVFLAKTDDGRSFKLALIEPLGL